jgi:hypothetical protein
METLPVTEVIWYIAILQWWAGGFYLLNKIFFSRAERAQDKVRKRNWKIASWLVYLVGLPAWVIIFYLEKDWIAFYVEISGAVIMLLGLLVAWIGIKKTPKWFVAIGFIAALVGMKYSFQDFGIMATIEQWLELGISIGFLIGMLLLAFERRSGYLWFVFMNICCGALMYIQGHHWLTLQQCISLFFVLDAWRKYRPAHPS